MNECDPNCERWYCGIPEPSEFCDRKKKMSIESEKELVEKIRKLECELNELFVDAAEHEIEIRLEDVDMIQIAQYATVIQLRIKMLKVL